MARLKQEQADTRRRHRARTPEAREQQLAAAAYDLAEEQIRGGTASSQVITHFLKAGSTREVLEKERIYHENQLLEVKREHIASQARVEELYLDALKAMKSYSGEPEPEQEDDESD